MSNFKVVLQKLETFIKKYYTNELIRGAIFFIAIGLLYFLFTLLVEYFLWLNSGWRRFLFWSFIAVELLLFIRFIIFPITKLLKLREGIGPEEASKIIGNHFPEVNDKLLNLLQLNKSTQESELLAASIDQKSLELTPIPFTNAIKLKENLKYLKYAAIPVFLFILISLLWGTEIFSSSYTRVINYDVAYEAPAPFQFKITNEELTAIENQSYTLTVETIGNLVPENIQIRHSGESFYMQPVAPGVFEYTFQQLKDPLSFNLAANQVKSPVYTLDVIKIPSFVNMEMNLKYPSYTGKESETIRSTGNAMIPEGTKVSWKISAKNTEAIKLQAEDTVYRFNFAENDFQFEKQLFQKFDYTLSTSNKKLNDYENLNYSIQIIKDQYPEIEVQSKVDSTNIERIFFFGSVSDDYGLSRLNLVYYPVGEEEKAKLEELPINKTTFDQFTFVFPGDLSLKQGVSYEYYFEVFDNDGINGAKSSKSGRFSFRKMTESEYESEQLKRQQEKIQGIDRSLNEMRENKEMLEELSRTQKEKSELNYNDQKKLEKFLKRQRQQEEMMKNFSKELKEELEHFQQENDEKDPFKEKLQERLEENEKFLEENEKLLEELQKMQDRIKSEELIDKLENISKQNRSQERNLEQLLELTKRFYVEKKAEKISRELQKLGEKQEQLGEKGEDENTKEAQDQMDKYFDKLMDELDDLLKENEELKNPMDIPDDPVMEESIKKDQKDAGDHLEKGQPSEAGEKQKDAGKKMQEMGKMMEAQMMSGQMETLDEDVEMLRRIVSNLIIFSFEQEDLMDAFKKLDYGSPVFGRSLNLQHELKQNFEHIDDSLYVLALRQPILGNNINKALTEVQFNLDQSLERLAQNQLPQGIGNQQYSMKGANDLALMLDLILNNMQMQMQMAAGQGSGKPEPGGEGEFQLPDIIQKQQSLMDQMGIGMGEGEGEGENQGEGNEKEGEGDSQGQYGDGKNGNREGREGDEHWSGELFEIYKQQQKIRQELEDLLREKGIGAGDLLRQMEKVEQDLLNHGFNERTAREMLLLKYELLKLEDAFYQQGEEEKRQATSNIKEYQNQLRMTPEEIKKHFQVEEILNKESLPLKDIYKRRVQEYFRNTDDRIQL